MIMRKPSYHRLTLTFTERTSYSGDRRERGGGREGRRRRKRELWVMERERIK